MASPICKKKKEKKKKKLKKEGKENTNLEATETRKGEEKRNNEATLFSNRNINNAAATTLVLP